MYFADESLASNVPYGTRVNSSDRHHEEVQIPGAPPGWKVPGAPPDWAIPNPKVDAGEPASFADVDNPGNWCSLLHIALSSRRKARTRASTCIIHFQLEQHLYQR